MVKNRWIIRSPALYFLRPAKAPDSMKKNLIIGAFDRYEWPQIAPWVLSIRQSGFAGDVVAIALNASYATLRKLTAQDCHLVVFNRDDRARRVHYASPLTVQIERFLFVYLFLQSRWRDYEFVIATDMRDVVFQCDPVAWLRENLGDNKLVVAGEGIRLKDEASTRQNFFETYGTALYRAYQEREVCNVGVLAGRSDHVMDLALNLFGASVNRQTPVAGRTVYNQLVHTQPYADIVRHCHPEDDWVCLAARIADPAKCGTRPLPMYRPPVLDHGVVRNASGRPYVIVHRYDRDPAWNDALLQRYGDPGIDERETVLRPAAFVRG